MSRHCCTPDDGTDSAWLCHVCGRTFAGGESQACSRCYKTTCALHLRHLTSYNRSSGLYELQPVCLLCAGAPGH